MTDLEITKLCAEAMDIHMAEGSGGEWAHKVWPDPDDNGGLFKYDPLHDDAQAMALLKKLRLQIEPIEVSQWRVWTEEMYMKYGELHTGLAPALNRAICECVAKMQAAK